MGKNKEAKKYKNLSGEGLLSVQDGKQMAGDPIDCVAWMAQQQAVGAGRCIWACPPGLLTQLFLKTGRYDHGNVKKWMKKAGRDPKTLQTMLVPVNQRLDPKTRHWWLLEVNFATKTMDVIDSLAGSE